MSHGIHHLHPSPLDRPTVKLTWPSGSCLIASPPLPELRHSTYHGQHHHQPSHACTITANFVDSFSQLTWIHWQLTPRPLHVPLPLFPSQTAAPPRATPEPSDAKGKRKGQPPKQDRLQAQQRHTSARSHTDIIVPTDPASGALSNKASPSYHLEESAVHGNYPGLRSLGTRTGLGYMVHWKGHSPEHADVVYDHQALLRFNPSYLTA
jgi:hypothetical protein